MAPVVQRSDAGPARSGAPGKRSFEDQRTRCDLREPAEVRQAGVQAFPAGPFRFFALDVETANNSRSSICQIGVACVRPDNSIETWVTYVDPKVDQWAFTYLHGISARTVEGAPSFPEALHELRDALAGATVYQHSGFDRTAINAACELHGLPTPGWSWRDSVQVARAAWPELRGNGGHGLASLKQYLGLEFEHHDAGTRPKGDIEHLIKFLHVQPAKLPFAPSYDSKPCVLSVSAACYLKCNLLKGGGFSSDLGKCTRVLLSAAAFERRDFNGSRTECSAR